MLAFRISPVGKPSHGLIVDVFAMLIGGQNTNRIW
jgi:hypothetical protein